MTIEDRIETLLKRIEQVDRSMQSLQNSTLLLITTNDKLRAAGNAAFLAMCDYRNSKSENDADDEVFQTAIDDLGVALNIYITKESD